MDNFEEASGKKEPPQVTDGSLHKPTTNKVGTYVDPFSAEKLNKIRQLRALKLKDQQVDECTKVSKALNQALDSADLHASGSVKHGYIEYNAKQQENEETFVNDAKLAKEEGVKLAKYGMMEAIWHRATEEARHKATKGAQYYFTIS